MRILLVDDDPALRALLRTTFEVADVAVVEAENAEVARRQIRAARPDVILLDVNMPGTTGLELCAELKGAPATKDVPIVLLTGADRGTTRGGEEGRRGCDRAETVQPARAARRCRATRRGHVRRPLPGGEEADAQAGEELLLYARDLRHMLEVERGQRELLQSAYLQTVSALASALESKDTGTRAHSQRVQSYASALAGAIGGEALAKTRARRTASCSTTSARSGSPTASCRSPAR